MRIETRTETSQSQTEMNTPSVASISAGQNGGSGGFEPPVPLGTLAFKVVDPLISSDRPSCMGSSSARAWPLPGLADRERMQPQMQPLRLRPLGRPSPVDATVGAGMCPTGLGHYVYVLYQLKLVLVGLVAGSDTRGLKFAVRVSRNACGVPKVGYLR